MLTGSGKLSPMEDKNLHPFMQMIPLCLEAFCDNLTFIPIDKDTKRGEKKNHVAAYCSRASSKVTVRGK